MLISDAFAQAAAAAPAQSEESLMTLIPLVYLSFFISCSSDHKRSALKSKSKWWNHYNEAMRLSLMVVYLA